MEIYVVSIGHPPDNWIESGYSLYQQMLRRPWRLNFIDIPPLKKNNLSVEQVKKEEAAKILKKVPTGAYIIALDEHGKQYPSVDLANFIEGKQLSYSRICFIIGGANGLDSSVVQKANSTISLSKMTLPHQLVKVVISEQIYRAWSIINNHPYHKS